MIDPTEIYTEDTNTINVWMHDDTITLKVVIIPTG